MESLALSSSLLTPPIPSLSSSRYNLVNASTSRQAPNLSLSLRKKSSSISKSRDLVVRSQLRSPIISPDDHWARCLLSSPSGLLVYGPIKRRLESRFAACLTHYRDIAACFPAWVRRIAPEVSTVALNSVHPKPEWTVGGIARGVAERAQSARRRRASK
ncbi:hypothetical protein F3Y22_tig00005929pilonHSYRG00012 [Hibiscus syriacus]|uniref:Uncharacterized protein n=1 Tax=Hibiscus syriacus TaxID=106335 RepID=A0A6A3CCS0_HIBSY|nr:hypothetical protein F3Y22_tig00005929pilonHSYRG00012 [Hibiscus syriacus]